MLRRFPALIVLTAITLGTSAFTLASFDVRHIFAAAGVGLIVLTYRKFDAWHTSVVRWQDRVDSALWGPEDGNGKRQLDAGVVLIVTRLSADLPRMTIAAQEAAAAAREAADMVKRSQLLTLEGERERRAHHNGRGDE